MRVDLLRGQLLLLTVEQRRQGFAHHLAPHAAIVAYSAAFHKGHPAREPKRAPMRPLGVGDEITIVGRGVP
ncbi:hypothetical protein MTER_30740 [Mycolicibacter terrae]|uniref:Uncharacterized protein n=1 Tax=Mycolicibacter terrae TaxID=1788 RepID=A0AAD1HXW0_9MYCO|nr:hypothetical protein MTER_30740 [Mycolicibacter terrae]